MQDLASVIVVDDGGPVQDSCAGTPAIGHQSMPGL
jgi:hypothetical protein